MKKERNILVSFFLPSYNKKMLLEIIVLAIIKRNHIGVSIIAGFNGKSRVASNITRKKMA